MSYAPGGVPGLYGEIGGRLSHDSLMVPNTSTPRSEAQRRTQTPQTLKYWRLPLFRPRQLCLRGKIHRMGLCPKKTAALVSEQHLNSNYIGFFFYFPSLPWKKDTTTSCTPSPPKDGGVSLLKCFPCEFSLRNLKQGLLALFFFNWQRESVWTVKVGIPPHRAPRTVSFSKSSLLPGPLQGIGGWVGGVGYCGG